MGIDLRQDITLYDMMGPVVAAAIFMVVLFVVSFFIINYYCVAAHDDITKFEEWGCKKNIAFKLGPHSKPFINEVLRTKKSETARYEGK
uniref:Col_cuticle_N domain-containing protein n=1 Tax=Rhabditophanes sp. KR3021 TaxID=114890 RepID=A0AC35UF93_9BILA